MKIGYDLAIWEEFRIKSAIKISLRSHPSLLLTGASGTGKSYALKWLICNALKEGLVRMTLCNYKNSQDLKFLSDYQKYFTFMDCQTGIDGYYEEFKQAQNRDTEFDGLFHILVFDEYPAFITSQDKATAERNKNMVAELLMMSRSYGFGCWVVSQRPDSSFFKSGARENFMSTISLGSLSKEAKSMLYSGEEITDRIYRPGEGICWIDGVGMMEIKFPKIRDMGGLEQEILQRLDGATEGKHKESRGRI